MSLELAIIEAIAQNDITGMKKLKAICDFLHNGQPEKNGYKMDDLPSDQKYEELSSAIQAYTIHLNLELGRDTSGNHGSYIRKDKKCESIEYNHFSRGTHKTSSQLFLMDGIKHCEKVQDIEHAILTPKYDGCSVGFNLLKIDGKYEFGTAHTRGTSQNTGGRNSQDITDKMKEIFTEKISLLNILINDVPTIDIMIKDSSKKGNDNIPVHYTLKIDEIVEIKIRSECVKKNKEIEQVHAGYAAGALSADPKLWDEKKHKIELIPFEIASITCDNETIVPTQESTIQLLTTWCLIDYEPVYTDLSEKTNMFAIFESFTDQILQPLDGIVYCASNWTYPICEEESSKRVNYAKYKWKPENKKQTEILGIEYSIGKTGTITPMFTYEPVVIDGKTYKNAKTTFKHLRDMEPILFKHLVCEIELKQNISPMVVEVYPEINKDKLVKKIPIVNKCPWCDQDLYFGAKTKGTITCSCRNDKCRMMVVKQCEAFLKSIGYKGISEKTLINMEYEKFEDLYRYRFSRELQEDGVKPKLKTAKTTQKSKINFDTIMRKINAKELVIALNIVTNTKASAYLEQFGLLPGDLFVYNIRKMESILPTIDDNVFAKDALQFLCNRYTE